jgi:hypothetical protein
MSIKVDLDQLADALADFGFGYLITVSDDHRAHTVAVDPVLTGGVFELGSMGNSTRRNLDSHGVVTVLWPPKEPGGYTLIVDGRGEFAGEALRVIPERAVLHRRAAPGVATRPGCKDDCLPLEG